MDLAINSDMCSMPSFLLRVAPNCAEIVRPLPPSQPISSSRQRRTNTRGMRYFCVPPTRSPSHQCPNPLSPMSQGVALATCSVNAVSGSVSRRRARRSMTLAAVNAWVTLVDVVSR